jgi:hypothetical protein
MKLFRTALIFLICVSASFAQYKATKTTEMPAGISPELKALLAPEGHAIQTDDGKTLYHLFFVKQVPAGSNTEMSVTNKDIAHGTLLGVAYYPEEYEDRRGQTVQAGTYTLRFSYYPINGAHQGVAPQRDFLILVKAEMDQDLASQPGYDMLMGLSMASSGIPHPNILSMWKNDYGADPGFVKEGEGEPEWVLYTTIGGKKVAILTVGVHHEG